MVKRFLLSAAVVGALATSAMAYDIYPSNDLKQMTYDSNAESTLISANASTNTGLIFPAYFVGNGWETTIKVVNTKNVPVVAKVVFYDGKDSKEVKDFNIYLSANDVWVGTVKVDSDGVAKIISTDDSSPLPMVNGEYKMASADNPMKEEITSSNGYIEVIPMVNFTAEAHGVNLRKAYLDFSKDARLLSNKSESDIVFQNGVVKNNVVRFPYVDINNTVGADNAYDIDGDGNKDGNFTTADLAGALDGYIRITDTVNGKDMIHKPVYALFDTTIGGDNTGLVYLEGEKANLADVMIEQNGTNGKYNLSALRSAIGAFAVNRAYITYGEAAINNMYAIVTSPFKRVAVQESLYENNTTNCCFEGIKLNDDKTDVESYGYITLIAQIYNNSEQMASASQFSPASTPTIKLYNEVSTTGYDVNDDNTLAHYISQAGFNEGFALLRRSDTNKGIPGIVTQMIATQAGGKVVTNWFDPITR